METRYTLRIYIAGSSREFYRVLSICGRETMETLCDEILKAIDFDHDHLYEFYLTKQKHRGPTILGDGLDPYGADAHYASEVELDDLNLVKGQKIYLHYDFGDDWEFVIAVQKVEEGADYAPAEVVKAKGELEQYPDWDE